MQHIFWMIGECDTEEMDDNDGKKNEVIELEFIEDMWWRHV